MRCGNTVPLNARRCGSVSSRPLASKSRNPTAMPAENRISPKSSAEMSPCPASLTLARVWLEMKAGPGVLTLVVRGVVLGLGHVCTWWTRVEIRAGGSPSWAYLCRPDMAGREARGRTGMQHRHFAIWGLLPSRLPLHDPTPVPASQTQVMVPRNRTPRGKAALSPAHPLLEKPRAPPLPRGLRSDCHAAGLPNLPGACAPPRSGSRGCLRMPRADSSPKPAAHERPRTGRGRGGSRCSTGKRIVEAGRSSRKHLPQCWEERFRTPGGPTQTERRCYEPGPSPFGSYPHLSFQSSWTNPGSGSP